MFDRPHTTVRRKRAWLWMLAVGQLLLAAAWLLATSDEAANGWTHAGLAAFYAVFFCGLIAFQRWWRTDTGSLQANEVGVWLDGKAVIRREHIAHGHLRHVDDQIFVRLARHAMPVDIAVSSEEEGLALLATMRLDPSRSVGQFHLKRGTRRGVWMRSLGVCAVTLVPYFVLAIVARGNPWILAAATAPLTAGLMIWAARQVIILSVGADGIRLRRRLAGSSFIPYSALASAEIVDRDVRLHLRDGETIVMHYAITTFRRLIRPDRIDEPATLADRINGLIAAHRRSDVDMSLLVRGDRSVDAWVRDVSLASDEHASFRAPAVPPDALWRVLEDPSAAPTARAGAALALRRRLDDEGRTRLRVLADACAAPRLRVALEAAAKADDGDVHALEAALAALDDDETELQAKRRRLT